MVKSAIEQPMMTFFSNWEWLNVLGLRLSHSAIVESYTKLRATKAVRGLLFWLALSSSVCGMNPAPPLYQINAKDKVFTFQTFLSSKILPLLYTLVQTFAHVVARISQPSILYLLNQFCNMELDRVEISSNTRMRKMKACNFISHPSLLVTLIVLCLLVYK